MTVETKRRGRPIGTGRDDEPDLGRIADRMVRDRSLKFTTAMKQVLAAPGPSDIRRLQAKWHKAKGRILAAAERRQAVPTSPRLPRTGHASHINLGAIAEADRAMRCALGGITSRGDPASHVTRAIYDALHTPLAGMKEPKGSVVATAAFQEALGGSLFGRMTPTNSADRAMMEARKSSIWPESAAARAIQEAMNGSLLGMLKPGSAIDRAMEEIRKSALSVIGGFSDFPRGGRY